jgi:transposase
MSYIRGEDRGQAALLPAAIEHYVAADAPVRVIDAFVDGLNVSVLGAGLFTARLIALDGSKFERWRAARRSSAKLRDKKVGGSRH